MLQFMHLKSSLFLLVMLLFSGFTAARQHNIDSLLQVVENNADDTNKVKAYHQLARQSIYRSPEEALEYVKDAEALSGKLNYQKGLADSYVYEGVVYMLTSQHEKSLGSYEKALEIYLRQKNKVGISMAYMNIATANQKLNHLEEAILNYEKAGTIYRETGDSVGVSSIYNNIALIRRGEGDLVVAMEYHMKALRILEENNASNELANTFNNIAVIYADQDDTVNAIGYFKRAYTMHLETENLQGAGNASNNIGTIYLDHGNNDSALVYYEFALNHYERMGNANGLTVVYQNVGNVYNNLEQHEKGLDYYLKALAIAKQIQENESLASLYLNIGRGFSRLENHQQSIVYIDKGVELAKKIKIGHLERDGYRNFYEAYFAMNDLANALEYYIKYTDKKEELFNAEVSGQLLDVREKYETEKKEIKIAHQEDVIEAERKENKIKSLKLREQELINREQELVNYLLAGGVVLLILICGAVLYLFYVKRSTNRKLNEINQRLELLNNELEVEKQNMELKALLAQINPHFIFNALNSVQKYIAANDKEQAFNYLSKFGKIMRSTLENSDESAISIEDELELLQLYVDLESRRLKHELEYEVTVDEDLDIYNLKIPPMLIQPYIENAIRHGIMHKQESGKIELVLKSEEESITCIVRDNGIGRKASMLLKKKNEKHQHKSMGMNITSKRLETLWEKQGEKFELQIVDLEDNANAPLGTEVVLKIPVEF
jgi:tetratricopeptide (TPR) repeat protein